MFDVRPLKTVKSNKNGTACRRVGQWDCPTRHY
jgi:hypothetical protein